jgi:8-hydroxy-5-deazaflavin:NADPH oxidoreductase
VKDVEAVVLSVPFAKYPDLTSVFSNVPADVAVIDTSNYYPLRDGAITEVDNRELDSVWVSEQIGRPVIKAWNAVLSHTLSDRGKPQGTPGTHRHPGRGRRRKGENNSSEVFDMPARSVIGNPRLLHCRRHLQTSFRIRALGALAVRFVALHVLVLFLPFFINIWDP